MAGISFVEVLDVGPGWNKVLASDGNVYTLKGDYNWRSFNPGNIEYGDFAKSMGAIGEGAVPPGRSRGFAIFPSMDAGTRAQQQLQFEGKNYRDKTISQAISRYAPEFENDSAAYAAALAQAVGVPVDTKLSDLTPEQRATYIAAQQRIEGMKPGTIMGADGVPVPPEVAQQFAAVRLPPGNIPNSKVGTNSGSNVRTYQQQLAQRGFDPGAIDGIRGPRTTAAVKAFQKANGLTVDGIVGPKTMAALQGQQRPSTQPQPPGWARQPANILAPPPLIQPSDVRDAFFNPLPAPSPLTPPRPEGGMLGGRPPAMGVPQPMQPPMPMPGRPGSLSALPPVPGRTAPAPMPGRPSGLNGAPPPVHQQQPAASGSKLLRLPSGAMIAPGTYDNAKSGIPYTVTEGPNGTAIINSQRAGFVDLGKEINAPTVLGGIIRSKIPEAAQDAMNNFGPAVQGVQTAATQAIDTVAPVLGNIKTGASNLVGGLFGGLFGGAPPAVPGPQFQQGMMGRGQPMRRPPLPLMPSPMLRSGNRSAPPQPPQMTATQRRQVQQDDWARRGLNEFGMLS